MSATRVLVSFKVTPDYEALRESDWAAGAAHGVETRYVRRILNCFDESALELALRLADATARDAGAPADAAVATRLGALSVGGREADPFLTTLQALGYEGAARVQTEAALEFAPAGVAALIAAYVRRVDRSDLVLLGCCSGPGDGGTIPFLVAEALGWPCLTQVTEVGLIARDRVRVAWAADDGLLRATLRLPCVLAVGNAVVSRLRVPTLKDRLASRAAAIDVLSPADLDVDVAGELRRGAAVLTGLEAIDRSRAGVIVRGEGPRAKARALYDAHLRGALEAT